MLSGSDAALGPDSASIDLAAAAAQMGLTVQNRTHRLCHATNIFQ